jgi:hypothetical protein
MVAMILQVSAVALCERQRVIAQFDASSGVA